MQGSDFIVSFALRLFYNATFQGKKQLMASTVMDYSDRIWLPIVYNVGYTVSPAIAYQNRKYETIGNWSFLGLVSLLAWFNSGHDKYTFNS